MSERSSGTALAVRVAKIGVCQTHESKGALLPDLEVLRRLDESLRDS